MPRRPLAFVSCALVQSSTTPQSATYLAMPRSRNDIAAEIPRAANAPPRSIEKKKLIRSEEHTSELQSLRHLVCRLLLEKKKKTKKCIIKNRKINKTIYTRASTTKR